MEIVSVFLIPLWPLLSFGLIRVVVWPKLIKQTQSGLQIFFKIGGPKWPMDQKMASHFLKWWAQAYQTNHSWHFCSVLYLQYIDYWWCSKTFLKRPLKREDQLSLNAGQKYCRMLPLEHSAILCSKGSILQYFWPSLSYHLLLRSLFFVFFEWLLKTCFTVLTTYMYFLFCGVHILAVGWIFFLLKWDFFTTKKDASTGPTALESDGPYFEIMGQWPRPTINLKACSVVRGLTVLLFGFPQNYLKWRNQFLLWLDVDCHSQRFNQTTFFWLLIGNYHQL